MERGKTRQRCSRPHRGRIGRPFNVRPGAVPPLQIPNRTAHPSITRSVIRWIFSAVAKESKGVAFQTVDVDKQSAVADRYHVEMLPTVVAVKNGREVGRLSGFQNAAKLKAFVKKHS